jgi:hypothetical protein
MKPSITAEVQAVVSLTVTLTNTVVAVKARKSAQLSAPISHCLILKFSTEQSQNITTDSIAEATAFSDAEKAIIASLIQAIATAAVASFEPAANLSAGLATIGTASIADVVQTLQTAIIALRTAATIDWTIT